MQVVTSDLPLCKITNQNFNSEAFLKVVLWIIYFSYSYFYSSFPNLMVYQELHVIYLFVWK